VSDPASRKAALLAEGLPEHAVERYSVLLRDAHQGLDDVQVPGDARREWIVPGRIEVLGKHVDYAGGRSLLCAVERGFVIVARQHADRSIVVRDATRREAIFMPLDVRSPTPSGPPWNVYLSAVARRFTRNFGADVLGCDIAIASNLPPAAGVSSSSALVVGLALAVAGISGLDWDDGRRAGPHGHPVQRGKHARAVCVVARAAGAMGTVSARPCVHRRRERRYRGENRRGARAI
jgi:hypothetical protein